MSYQFAATSKVPPQRPGIQQKPACQGGAGFTELALGTVSGFPDISHPVGPFGTDSAINREPGAGLHRKSGGHFMRIESIGWLCRGTLASQDRSPFGPFDSSAVMAGAEMRASG